MTLLKSRISVIIPTFNRAHCILRAVKTVARQTHENLEIIVVDDGSTDNTSSLIKSYKEQEPRLQVISRKANAGVSTARNIGINAATGDYIALFDDDDLWVRTKLELQLRELMKEAQDALALCLCNVRINKIDNQGRRLGKQTTSFDNESANREWASMYPSSWLASRQTFDKVGLFDPEMHCMEDHDWDTRLRKLGGKLIIVDSPQLIHFSNDGAIYKDMAKSMELYLIKHGQWLAENHRGDLYHWKDKLGARNQYPDSGQVRAMIEQVLAQSQLAHYGKKRAARGKRHGIAAGNQRPKRNPGKICSHKPPV